MAKLAIFKILANFQNFAKMIADKISFQVCFQGVKIFNRI